MARFIVFTTDDAVFVFSGVELNELNSIYKIGTLYASKIAPAGAMDEMVGKVSDSISVLQSSHSTRDCEEETDTEPPNVRFQRVQGGFKITPERGISSHTIAWILVGNK
jgi:hypothetical protein